MPTVITNTVLLDPTTPYKMVQHHEGNGVISDDIIIFGRYDMSPNSRIIIDRQKLYIKVERSRMVSLHFVATDVPAQLNLQRTVTTWNFQKVYILNDKVLYHGYDKYPDAEDAVILSKNGYSLAEGEVLWLAIDQDSNELKIYF